MQMIAFPEQRERQRFHPLTPRPHISSVVSTIRFGSGVGRQWCVSGPRCVKPDELNAVAPTQKPDDRLSSKRARFRSTSAIVPSPNHCSRCPGSL